MRQRACSPAGTCSASGRRRDPPAFFQFFYNGAQHDTSAKTFSFPIYTTARGRSRRVRHRGACRMESICSTRSPAIRRPRAGWRRSSGRFSSARFGRPTRRSSPRIANVYPHSDWHMSPVVRAVLMSQEFDAPDSYFARFSWPVEFVVRALKEVGYAGFSAQRRARRRSQHGPAAVRAAGRRWMGAGTGMVHDRRHARANEFRGHADVAAAQRHRGGRGGQRPDARSAAVVLSGPASRRAPFERARTERCLLDYLRGGAPGPERDASCRTKAPGSRFI